jgi:acetyltransferase
MADPDNERAESAILLRHYVTGLGLGTILIRRIIEYARTRGLVEIYGQVLCENRSMLKLCRIFGFTAARCSDDLAIMNASLRLSVFVLDSCWKSL